jgi:hypothetical protein
MNSMTWRNGWREDESMRSAKEIQREGDGLRVLSRGEVGAAFKAARAKKIETTSYWTRKRGKATK